MDQAPIVDTEEGFAAYNANRRGWECAVEPTAAGELVAALKQAKTRRIGPPIEDTAKIEAAKAAVAPGERFEHPVDAYVNVDNEINAQEAAALAAVEAVAASGALGDQPLTVNIKGHANPGNEQVQGHTLDHISIHIGQVAPVHPDVQAEIDAQAGA